MQGAFPRSAIRDDMRLGGFFNPMDAGAQVDSSTGRIISGGPQPPPASQRRSILSRGAPSAATTTGPVQMGAPWNSGNGGVVAPRLGVLSMGQDGSGHTTQAPRSLPSGAYRDFWKEYANILVRFTVLHSMSYPYPRDGSETPVTNQMLEDALVKTRVEGDIADEEWKKWSNMVGANIQLLHRIVEGGNSLDKDITTGDNYNDCLLLRALDLTLFTTMQLFSTKGSKYSTGYDGQVTKMSNYIRRDAPDQWYPLIFKERPRHIYGFANSSTLPEPVVQNWLTLPMFIPVLSMGGEGNNTRARIRRSFITANMALHLVRWPGIFALRENQLINIVSQLCCDLDPQLLVLSKGLFVDNYVTNIPANEPDKKMGPHTLFAAFSVAHQTMILRDLHENAAPFGYTKVPGSSCRFVLSWCRDAIYKDFLGEEAVRSDFFNMSFNDWVDGLWPQLSPFMSLKNMGFIQDAIAASLRDQGVGPALMPLVTRRPMHGNVDDFIDNILKEARIGVQTLGGYVDAIMRDEDVYQTYRRAQHLDHYYAGMVKGACIRVSMNKVWCAVDADAPGALNDEKFLSIVWNIVRKLQPEWALSMRMSALQGLSTRTSGQQALAVVQQMRDVRDAMVDIWKESSKFAVSNEVHAAEIQVLSRLKRDGLIPWFDTTRTKLSALEVCNWFRRSECIRTQFALVVGKRMATESLVSTSNAGIINHQRTASWSEREYMSFYERVETMGSEIEAACCCQYEPFPWSKDHPDSYLYVDYLNIQKHNYQRSGAEEATRRVELVYGDGDANRYRAAGSGRTDDAASASKRAKV